MSDRVAINDASVSDTIANILPGRFVLPSTLAFDITQPMPELIYGNYGINSEHSKFSAGFYITHIKSGIAVRCDEGRLLANVEQACRAMAFLLPHLENENSV